jgi:hypothetical protein
MAATRRVSGAAGCTAGSCVSCGPPGTRSRQVVPPSAVLTRAPASTAAQSREDGALRGDEQGHGAPAAHLDRLQLGHGSGPHDLMYRDA